MTEDIRITDLRAAIDKVVDAEIKMTKMHALWDKLDHRGRDAEFTEAIAEKDVAWKALDKVSKEINAELAKVPEVEEAI